MEITGKITISRTHSNTERCARIQITLEEDMSRTHIIEISMTLTDFAKAITGWGHMPFKGEFFENAPIGMLSQIEYRLIPLLSWEPRTKEERLEDAKAHLRQYEKDGWKGSPEDLWNPHCHKANEKGEIMAEVIFRRWIKPITD